MENQSANCFLTLPIGDKILEVEIPGDVVPPQGAHEDGGPSGGCLDQGVLGLGDMEENHECSFAIKYFAGRRLQKLVRNFNRGQRGRNFGPGTPIREI